MVCKTDTNTSGANTPPSEFEANTSDSPTQPDIFFDIEHHDHEVKLSNARYGCSLDDPQCKDMILVMGTQGVGKSMFINTLVGGDVSQVGDGTTPCTKSCLLVPTRIGKTKVILIDTPSCEDYNNNPTALLFTQIFTTLARQYQRGVSLRGIIYIQRIDPEQGPDIDVPSPESIFKMFQDICGDSSLFFRNIILATRGWQLPGLQESVGAVREGEYCKLWEQFLARGMTMGRYYGERDSAVSMVSRIIGNIDVPYEPEGDIVKKGTDLLLQMRSNVATELERLLQSGMLLKEDLGIGID